MEGAAEVVSPGRDGAAPEVASFRLGGQGAIGWAVREVWFTALPDAESSLAARAASVRGMLRAVHLGG